MNALAKLTPAETLFLLEERNADLKLLLKVTLMDLLLKQVLATDLENRRFDNDKAEKIINGHLTRGEAFHTYIARPHEEVYLRPFRSAGTNAVPFRRLVGIGLDRAGHQRQYQNLCLHGDGLAGCFSQSLLQRLTRSYQRTPQGAALCTLVDSERLHLENNLSGLLETAPAQAAEIIRTIKGNVFLLRNLDFDLLKRLDGVLNSAIQERTTDTWDDSPWMWMAYVDTFDESWHPDHSHNDHPSTDSFDHDTHGDDNSHHTWDSDSSSWDGGGDSDSSADSSD